MAIFDFRFTVQASLAAVQRFHQDTRALKVLTPPPVCVQIHEVQPLAEGSISRFTLWFGPLPLRWTAVHERVSEHGFTDRQSAGPMQVWEHTHTFVPLSAGVTEIREHIVYQHRSGVRGALTRVLLARPNLQLMFMYRKFVTRRALESNTE